MFLNCKKASNEQPKCNFQYKTKTINDNGNIKTYEWDFDKNTWNLVSVSGQNCAAESTPTIDNSNEEKPIAFDNLSDVFTFLDNEMKKDKKGEQEFETWKKAAKEEYETPKCEAVDLEDENDDPFVDLGCGVLKEVDREKYVIFNSFNDTILDDETYINFNNSDEFSSTAGVTDTQLLTILAYRLQDTPIAEYINKALKLICKD